MDYISRQDFEREFMGKFGRIEKTMRDFDLDILDQMAKRFNPLPTGDRFLDNRYDWQKNENGAEWPYYRFFYHLGQVLKPELVVELGGYQGTAAAHFAKGLQKNNYVGKVISIDHHSDPGDEINRDKMTDACRVCLNMDYLQGWSCEKIAMREKDKHYGDADSVDHIIASEYNAKIDILFIDSWHHYDCAMMDWEAYRPLLNKPALIICDDIQDGDDPEAPIYGMTRFWEQMPEPKFLNFNLHPGTGMGFVKWE